MRGGNVDQGVSILDDARHKHTDSASQAMLDSQLVLLHAFRPDLEQAEATARRLIEATSTPVHVRIAALTSLGLVLIWRCRFDEASAATAQADRLGEGCDDLSAELGDRIGMSAAAAGLWAGHLDRALPKLRSGYQDAFAPPIGDYAGLWAHFLGQALRMSGAVKEAAEVGRDAVNLIDRVDPTGSRAMVYAQQAINLGQVEDSAGIEDMIARLRREPPGPPPRAAWPLIAEGWSRAVDGDIPAAMDLLCRAGNAALEDGLPVISAWALYDTVRWGASQRSDELLRRTADQTTSRTINAVADHAAALLARDPTRLEWVASDYAMRAENLNATLAYTQAAQLHQDSGSNVRATRAITKAHLLASEATQLELPLCATVHSHLTTREAEIANLAARGLSSKKIARRLYISVRTVDNHLASAYVKLGVHSRSELGVAIIPPA
jgi:DNA-binding NarL/FixJ family response regulator